MPATDRPHTEVTRRVAVFREAWLLGSETFIRNQVTLLTRWQAHPVGMKKVESPLAAPTDLIAAPGGLRGRLARVGLRWFGRSQRLTAALRRLGPDLIHAHFARDAIIIAPLAARLGIPLVVTLHGSDITALPNAPGRAGRRYRRQLRAMFGQAERIIVVSEFIRDQALRHGAPHDRVVVSYIGIPLTDRSSAAPIAERRARDAADAETGTRYELLFVGRLVGKKGVADAIDAIAALPQHLRERVRFTVAGAGPLREALEAQAAARGIEARFLGAVDSAQARELMEESHLFLAPSRRAPNGDSEGFGMVFAEAAAAGLPVVSYRHGGVPEAVADGQTGLLVDEGDVAGLSTALQRLLEDPAEARKLGEAGAARVAAKFDCAVLTAELEDIYDAARASARS